MNSLRDGGCGFIHDHAVIKENNKKKYRIRIPAIFTIEIEFDSENDVDALITARKILIEDYGKLQWKYESTASEEYWRILTE